MILDERSSAGCSLAAGAGLAHLGWTGTDLRLNLMSSPDGTTFGDKRVLDERSYKTVTHTSSSGSGGSTTTTERVALPPALAVSGERLHLAWTGGDGAVNLLAQPGVTPTTLAERSGDAPALAVHDSGALVLAWTGTDRHVNLALLAGESPPGRVGPVPGKIRLEQARSGDGPALCVHRGSLVLAWTGTDRCVNLIVGADDPYRPPLVLEQARTSHPPVLCSHAGSLVLAWTGTDRCVNLIVGADDPYRPPVRIDRARSSGRPALCDHAGELLLGWTGTDRRPNIIALASSQR